jgi:hypothetical protein
MPWQGLLTILLAVTLIDFAGRRKWQRKVMGRVKTPQSVTGFDVDLDVLHFGLPRQADTGCLAEVILLQELNDTLVESIRAGPDLLEQRFALVTFLRVL